MAASTKPARAIGIDLARSIAIGLAMASHVAAAVGLFRFYGGTGVDAARVTLALATPTFIVLFGVMLELVYAPRFRGAERVAVAARLIGRGLQCWLLYALSVLVLFVAHPDYSWKFSVATVLMLGVTPFTDILKFYAVALAAAPLLLWLRARAGLGPLLVAALAVHALYPLLRGMPGPQAFGLPLEAERLAMFGAGIGEGGLGGPSVLHGLTLVAVGMGLGRVLFGGGLRDGAQAGRVRRRAAALFGLSVAALAVDVALWDADTLRGLGNLTLRMDSHPLYFATGVLGTFALTGALTWLTAGRSAAATARLTRLAFFGRTSLFTFAFGNMLLYVAVVDPATGPQALANALALLAAITALSLWFDWTSRRGGPVAAAAAALRGRIDALSLALVERLAAPAAGSARRDRPHSAPRSL